MLEGWNEEAKRGAAVMTLHGWEGGVIEQSPERGKGKGEENLMRKAN